MIVKVQVSILSPEGPLALVYDKQRKYEYHGPMTEDLKLLMGKRPKAFFVAHIDAQRRFSIAQEAPWQTW